MFPLNCQAIVWSMSISRAPPIRLSSCSGVDVALHDPANVHSQPLRS
jgi:hypothetical protein